MRRQREETGAFPFSILAEHVLSKHADEISALKLTLPLVFIQGRLESGDAKWWEIAGHYFVALNGEIFSLCSTGRG